MYIAAIFLAFTVLYVLQFSTRQGKLPPGPVRLPLIGNLHLLGSLPHKSVTQLARVHGPIMSLRLGSVTSVVISSVAAAKEVLQKQDLAFSSRAVSDSFRAQNHATYSVVMLPAVSPRWRALRKIMSTNIFAGSQLNASLQLRRSKVQELIDYCQRKSEAGEAVNIGSAVFNTSFNLLFRLIFSRDATDITGSDSDGGFRHMVRNIMMESGMPNMADFFPVLRRIDPQGIRRRTSIHMGKALQVFGALIDERLEKKKSGPAEDVIDILLELSRQNPEEFDRTLIEHLCLDLFLGAADTTSSTVEWAMAEALSNSDILKKAKSEMERVVGKGKVIEESDFQRLPYLQSLVKETYRLHPPLPLLVPRKTEQEVNLCGYTVPKGSHVWVNVWGIGRDPEVWENPLEFNPNRFLESSVDIWGTDFELTPFGAGRRICPGMPLGARMVPLVLGSLVNAFDWKNIGEELDMTEKFGLTMSRVHALKLVPVLI